MKKIILLLSSSLCVIISVFSQRSDISVYPMNWWVNMTNPKLELMVHCEDIGKYNVSLSYPGIKLEKVHHVENINYLFLDLALSPGTKPGNMIIKFTGLNNKSRQISYKLRSKNKEDGNTRVQGVTSSDLIYFIMPDRFSNGDTSNDRLRGLKETATNRDSLKGRHGGDLKGVEQHLDYIIDLGATTIWLTPVIINDMEKASYHGYAFTDHYTIDPRLGGEEGYFHLIEAAHNKGLKIIQDAVYNHVGLLHVTVKDMPMKDWLNEWPHYQNTSFKDQTLMDPYAAAIDKQIMSDGWFEPMMPDLNQKNPFVANYLLQHAIWTTETFGIDGWRIDTYAYCDRDFMNRCNKSLLDEFPKIGIFAETWVHGVINQSFFTRNVFDIPYKSNLPGVTDFQLHYAMDDALNQNYGWMEGFSALYSTLANDFVYRDAFKNCIFLDNHDMNRFFSTVSQDLRKYKMGINWLMTLRGIPQLYYGTEILMSGTTNPSEALVRQDFPGGWPADSTNKFNASGRTAQENEAFTYVRTLANFRKNSSALKTGKLMQYVPLSGIYVYFRYDPKQTIMVVSNSNEIEVTVKLDRFTERTQRFSKMKNIQTGETTEISDLKLAGKGSNVYELLK